jgi:hypothetical protein
MIHSFPKSCEQYRSEIGYPVPHRLSASKTDSSKERAIAVVSDPYTGPSRVFPKFEHPFPCFKGEPRLMIETPAAEGILFQRPHKTGSTTMVGIVLRLVHNRAKGKPFNNTCKHRAIHGTARHYRYQERDRTKSFLFSIIRDPTTRIISEFFHFDVTAYEREPTDSNFLGMIRQKGHNYYLKQLTTRHYVPNGTIVPDLDFAKSKGYKTFAEFSASHVNREQLANMEFGVNYSPTQIVEEILYDYDFIAITERMDESLVALQMLLGLTTKEIIYTHARSSGSFSNGWHGRPCFYIMKAFLTPGMKKFFASEEYKATVANDFLMYQAANKSLDRTLASLDPVEFEKNMAALQRGLQLAAKNCKGRIRTLCDDGGTPILPKNTTCYIWSEGCDHACVDELDL